MKIALTFTSTLQRLHMQEFLCATWPPTCLPPVGAIPPRLQGHGKILDSVCIQAGDGRLNKVISELNRKNTEDVIV